MDNISQQHVIRDEKTGAYVVIPFQGEDVDENTLKDLANKKFKSGDYFLAGTGPIDSPVVDPVKGGVDSSEGADIPQVPRAPMEAEEEYEEPSLSMGQSLGVAAGAVPGALQQISGKTIGMKPRPPLAGGMTPGQKWAKAVTSSAGFQPSPDDYSVREAATRYNRAMGNVGRVPEGKRSHLAAKKFGINAPLTVEKFAKAQPSPLDQVTKMFLDRTRQAGVLAQRAPLLSYPLAGGMIGGDVAGALTAYDEGGLRAATPYAASGLGTLLSLFPATAPVGIPLSAGAQLYKAAKDAERLKREDPEEYYARIRSETEGAQPILAP